jgi:hypothetical protein
MSLKGGNSGRGKEVECTETPDVVEQAPDFTPGDLKVKLPDEFDGNRSKLDPFLVQCELYMAFNQYKFKTET